MRGPCCDSALLNHVQAFQEQMSLECESAFEVFVVILKLLHWIIKFGCVTAVFKDTFERLLHQCFV